MHLTEICVQVYSSLSVVQEKLNIAGFKFVGSQKYYDNYYTHIKKENIPTATFSRLMQNTLLLRTERTKNSEKDVLVYKNKTLNTLGEVIREELLETPVVNIEMTKRMFTLAGFTNWSRLVVDEYIFVKNDIKIILQDAEHLGLFLEIPETPNMKGSAENKFRELTYIANSLRLDLGKDFSCKKNYMLYQKENNIIV